MGVEGDSREKVAVKTYVPERDRNAWKSQATDLDMSLSEFVRCMVNAGRRDFDLEHRKSDSEDATPGGEGLKEQVIEVLAREGPLEWDDIVGELIGDFEDELEATLSELQSANRVQYSGRKGGYRLLDDDE